MTCTKPHPEQSLATTNMQLRNDTCTGAVEWPSCKTKCMTFFLLYKNYFSNTSAVVPCGATASIIEPVLGAFTCCHLPAG